jgi:hypothetical protein
VKRAAALFAACATACLAAAPARAGTWSLEPRVSVGTEYTDNPQLSTQQQLSDASAQIDASLRLTAATETLRLTFEPRVLAARYRDDKVLDRTDRMADLALERTGERGTLRLAASLVRDSTLTSEFGSSGLTTVDYPHRRLLLSAQAQRALSERWSFAAQLGWSQDRYDAPAQVGFSDYRYASAWLVTSYDVSEKTRVSVQGGGSRLEVPSRPLIWTYSTALAVERVLTDKLRVSVSAGPSRVLREGRSQAGQYAQLAVIRDGERVLTSLSIARETSPTGRGVLDRRDRWSLEVSAPFSERTAGQLRLIHIRSREVVERFSFLDESLRYLSADASITRRLTPELSAMVSVGWRSQRRDFDAGTAYGLRGGIWLQWTGRPLGP